LGGIEGIRADNAEKLNQQLIDRKKAKIGGVKKPRETKEKDAAPAAPTPAMLKVPAAIAKKVNASIAKKANQKNPAYWKKIRTIRNYLDNRVLAPILQANVDPDIIRMTPKTVEEAEEKIQAFKSALNKTTMNEKADKLLEAGGKLIQTCTGNGQMLDMDLTGYVSVIACNKKDAQVELEEFKCEFGDWLSAPWYVRLGMFYFKAAQITNDRNKNLMGEAEDPKGKGPEH